MPPGPCPARPACRPELKQCILVDQPAQLAAKCSSIPDCVAMVIKPVPGRWRLLPLAAHCSSTGGPLLGHSACTAALPAACTMCCLHHVLWALPEHQATLGRPVLSRHCSSKWCALPLPHPAGLPSSLHAGNLRNAFNTSELGLSPTDLMYVRESVLAAHSSGSSSGLSGGAVAGIAVGACAAAAALTGAAWLALRRRQRQRRPLGSMGGSSGPKGLEAGGSSGGSAANGSTQTCSALGTEGPASSHLGLASGGLTSPANPASNTCGPQAQPAAAARELPPAGPPCMRAAWDPSHTPSPFAAQATTPFDAPIMPPSPFVAQAATPIDAAATPPSPFAAQAATPIGSAVPATAAGSSVAVLEGINSRRYTSSRNAAVLSVVATEAEAAATAAASMAAAAAASASGTGSSGHDSFSHSSEEQPLPELAHYVAQCDAACNAGLRGAPSLAQELTSISIDSLPPSLRVGDGPLAGTWWLEERAIAACKARDGSRTCACNVGVGSAGSLPQ